MRKIISIFLLTTILGSNIPIGTYVMGKEYDEELKIYGDVDNDDNLLSVSSNPTDLSSEDDTVLEQGGTGKGDLLEEGIDDIISGANMEDLVTISSDSVLSNGGEVDSAKALEDFHEEDQEEMISENNIDIVSEGELNDYTANDVILNVAVPKKIEAYLDPENLSGKGEVFSNQYEIINYGNVDVAIKINKIDISGGLSENRKKMDIDMVWMNENENYEKILNVVDGKSDEYVVYLKASEYDENGQFVEVNDSSKGSFYFSGALNINPNMRWINEGISVDFNYEIISLENEEYQEEFVPFIGNSLFTLEEQNVNIENNE